MWMPGCLRNFSEQLQWASAYDGFIEMVQSLKEVGSLIFWMSLLDSAMVRVTYPTLFCGSLKTRNDIVISSRRIDLISEPPYNVNSCVLQSFDIGL